MLLATHFILRLKPRTIISLVRKEIERLEQLLAAKTPKRSRKLKAAS